MLDRKDGCSHACHAAQTVVFTVTAATVTGPQGLEVASNNLGVAGCIVAVDGGLSHCTKMSPVKSDWLAHIVCRQSSDDLPSNLSADVQKDIKQFQMDTLQRYFKTALT